MLLKSLDYKKSIEVIKEGRSDFPVSNNAAKDPVTF